jgi:hypothetical protein
LFEVSGEELWLDAGMAGKRSRQIAANSIGVKLRDLMTPPRFTWTNPVAKVVLQASRG